MADDDEKKKHTLDSLFALYANFPALQFEVDNEVHDSILLSQIDYWLDQAKLLEIKFTRTQTGLIYMKYNKWRLNYEDFLEFLDQLCEQGRMDIEDLKKILVETGIPGSGEATAVTVK